MPQGLIAANRSAHVIVPGAVLSNTRLCNEHFRITFRVRSFPPAYPGQFLHLGSHRAADATNDSVIRATGVSPMAWGGNDPFLRRAFSIAGLRRSAEGVELDVIYRVVGSLTGWLAKMRAGDPISILGPQGNRFPIQRDRPNAWLVAGGVGLPPLLWFAEELHAAKKIAVFFYGAQRADVVALRMDAKTAPASDACAATMASVELADLRVPVVVSTDDGSLGFCGHVGQALEAFWQANPVPPEELVLYTCGPERMMRFVAEFAARIGAMCFACVERSMACATGMCQSCVVATRDANDTEGWRYRLCCTDGPVFDAAEVIWDLETFGRTWKPATN